MGRLFLSLIFLLLSLSLYGEDALLSNLDEHIHYSLDKPNQVGYLKIGPQDQAIDQSTWIYVRDALEHYKDKRPIFIILELNTPGGELYAAEQISEALREMDERYGVPIVAVIDRWAISAGALLAYSCRYIAVTKDASMGAAEPVFQTAEGMETAPEKINSVLRTEFGTAARLFGRNPAIAEAMVDKDLILVRRDGSIIILNDKEELHLEGDEILSPAGKLLTINAEQMLNWSVANLILPTQISGEITLMTTPFFNEIPDVVIDSVEPDWRIHFFALLSNPLVRSLLFLGMMVGCYIEISTPGFGMAGAVALICLFFTLLSSYSISAATWLEWILLIMGLLLLSLEIFVIPSFGIVGILGVILTIVGLFGVTLPHVSSFEFIWNPDAFSFAGQRFLEDLAWLSGALIVGVIIICILSKYVTPQLMLFNRIISRGEQEASCGYVREENFPPIGSVGKVVSPLRPSGKVIIEDTIYDAMSSGVFVESNTEIRVVAIEGSKVKVDPIL